MKVGLLLLLSRFSRVQLFTTPWTAAHQAPSVHGIFQARGLEWDDIAFSVKVGQACEIVQCTTCAHLPHI